MMNGVPRKTDELYALSRATCRPNEIAPMRKLAPMPSSTPRSLSSSSSRSSRSCQGCEGRVAAQMRKSQLTNGTKNQRTFQGDSRASISRRSVIETPIQRKGTAHAAMAVASHSGAPSSACWRSEKNGVR